MQITSTKFDRLDAVEITTSKVKMIAVTEMGPRIAFLGRPDGENLFYWENDDIGRHGWKLLGGHRVWLTRPGADEAEDTYAADNAPCTVEIHDSGVKLRGGTHAFLNISRGIDIEIVDEETFCVTSFLTNEGPMLFSGGVWAPTCINPFGGRQFGIPLGDRSKTWDVVKIVIPRSFGGHTARVNDPQIILNEDFMIIDPQGIETKRMVMAPLGIIAMSCPKDSLSFIKRSDYNPQGQYPLGCNLAVYIGPNNFMVEMETYGQEQTVLPGETITNVETWKLVDTVFDWQNPLDLTKFF